MCESRFSLVFLVQAFKYGDFQGSSNTRFSCGFIDEDNLPLACIHLGNHFIGHPESEEELGSDFSQNLVVVSQRKSWKATKVKIWR